MSRIKVDLPEKFIFSTEVPVRIGDINYGGHLGHDSFLPITHEARLQFLDSLGYSELDIGGLGIILSGAEIEYIAESFYGDNMTVSIGISNFHKYGFDIIYQLLTTKGKKEVGRVRTSIVLYDYEQGKVTRIPDKVLRKLESL